VRAAVTGAGGFIGSATTGALNRAGMDVAPHSGPEQFDICDTRALTQLFSGCDAVVHMAGPPSVSESLADPLGYARAHVMGTASVLEAMRCGNVRALVYISSAEVYGRAQSDLVAEDHPLAPRSPYGASKAAAEMLVRAACARRDVGGYIIRPFSIYGERMPASSLMTTILRQAHDGDVVTVQDLTPVRDYCYVGDLAELIALAVSRPRADLVTLNAAYGKGYSVAEVIAAAGAALERHLDAKEASQKRPPGVEIARLVADVGAAQRELGWRAKHDLQDGIRAMHAATAP
jgi:nucleoside-diphosphate-sugar epimerase